MFHEVLQLSCELEHLIRCLRAVPTSAYFVISGGHECAKEARYDESWKYIEPHCTVRNDAAAVCSKHGESRNSVVVYCDEDQADHRENRQNRQSELRRHVAVVNHTLVQKFFEVSSVMHGGSPRSESSYTVSLQTREIAWRVIRSGMR